MSQRERVFCDILLYRKEIKMERTKTRKSYGWKCTNRGQNKVVIQSMCNTKTKDIQATVNQILDLEKAGCEIIRVACLDMEDARAIKEIKEKNTYSDCC